MAEKFVALGHHVAGCRRNAAAVEQLQETFPDHHFLIVDVADDGEVARWAEERDTLRKVLRRCPGRVEWAHDHHGQLFATTQQVGGRAAEPLGRVLTVRRVS
jgi:NAD(P)-dependent dehydrogenase (short-subunit alcohol dehydrogenase family)